MIELCTPFLFSFPLVGLTNEAVRYQSAADASIVHTIPDVAHKRLSPCIIGGLLSIVSNKRDRVNHPVMTVSR